MLLPVAVLLTVAIKSSRSVSGPKAGWGRTTATVRVLTMERRARIGVVFLILACGEGVGCLD